ncbi:MAG: L-threonylcarbamoyladenylate synthase [Chloroflexota bacterium]
MVSKLASDVQSQVRKGIEVMRCGGIVAYPTDTVYGLGAAINLPGAVGRVFAVKQRPLSMAFPVLLANAAQLAQVAKEVPPVARQLIERFWPGALTIVLLKSDFVPDIVTAGSRTVAVRIPAHPVAIALIEGMGVPMVGTSANRSGQISPVTAEGVRTQFGSEIDLVIDGGQSPGGKESTVVDATGMVPVILREGAISVRVLQEVFGNIVVRKGE